MKRLFSLLLVLLLLSGLVSGLASCGSALTTTGKGSTAPAGTNQTPQSPSQSTADSNPPDRSTPGTTGATVPVEPIDPSLSCVEILNRLIAVTDIGINLIVEPLDLSDNDMFHYRFDIDYEPAVTEAGVAIPFSGTSIPFFMGVLKAKTAADAARLARSCEENADLHKWICVFFSVAKAESQETIVLYVMDREADRVDRIMAAFDALFD